MPIKDLEACQTFVYANRLIASRFKAKAEEVLEVVQTIEDIDSRLLLADLSHAVERRARQYESIATLQERDMGVRCHCPATGAD
ncbi:hypothetical protein [Terriglobus roseus]|uniref:Uncharacterized protein n=1 Tax=Terriglobus roseus TaxID=392734 RepID=A0A1H4N6I4_9BACT|nr:hypothetical protein [Terriglobus roseus]SEB90926.1 hypothetical protein SAMN05443244_2156 [Terriglobus roseus]